MQTKLLVVIIGLVLNIFSFSAFADSNVGPSCLAENCLDKSSLSVKKILKSIGNVHPTEGDISYYCYAINGDGFFRIGVLKSEGVVVSMLLSKSEACLSQGKAKYKFSKFVTEKKIALGSSDKQVIAAYGNPVKILDANTAYKRWLSDDSGKYYHPEKLDEFWLYGPDTDPSLVRGIGMYQGHVISILLQDSP